MANRTSYIRYIAPSVPYLLTFPVAVIRGASVIHEIMSYLTVREAINFVTYWVIHMYTRCARWKRYWQEKEDIDKSYVNFFIDCFMIFEIWIQWTLINWSECIFESGTHVFKRLKFRAILCHGYFKFWIPRFYILLGLHIIILGITNFRHLGSETFKQSDHQVPWPSGNPISRRFKSSSTLNPQVP